jgi:eukaryotic-like serine/threonine-protein kinase
MSVETLTPGPPRREPPVGLRFGPFELDLETTELKRCGLRVKLQLQPSRVLALLASRPGRLLTREEIQHEVWPDGTFVDFEQAVNFCIRQIRSALGDHAVTPLYIETLPRRGYRFIAPVEPIHVLTTRDKEVRAILEARPAEPTPLPDAEPDRTRPRRGRLRLVAAALLLALLSGAGGYALRQPASRTTPTFTRLTFDRGYVGSARFGPGDQVLYTAAWDGGPLAVYDVATGDRDSRPVATAASRVVAVSHTGDVAYLRDPGTLTRAPLAGGPSKDLLEGIRTADRTPDGGSFAVARDAPDTTRIEFPVGTVLCEALRPTHLRIAPDGQRVAFLEHPIRADDRGQVSVVDRSGHKKILSGGWASIEGLAWSPAGNEIWFTAARLGGDLALYAVDLEGRERLLVPALGRLVLHDVARDGRVLLERKTLRLEMRFGTEDSPEERDLSWMDLAKVQALSPDGKSLLFVQWGEVGGPDYGVYLRGTDGTQPMRLGSGRPLGFSADGRFVVAIPVRNPDHIELLPVGAGETRSLREPGVAEFEWATWVPGRDALAFTARQNGAAARVFLREVSGGLARPLTPPGVAVHGNTVSPDGRTIAVPCVTGEGWCLQPLDGGPAVPVPGTRGMTVLGFTEDNTALYLRDKSRRPANIFRLTLGSGKLEPWRELSPRDTSGVVNIHAVAVTPDGRAWAYSYARQMADLYLVTGLVP